METIDVKLKDLIDWYKGVVYDLVAVIYKQCEQDTRKFLDTIEGSRFDEDTLIDFLVSVGCSKDYAERNVLEWAGYTIKE